MRGQLAIVWLVAFLSQMFIWQATAFTDEDLWLTRAAQWRTVISNLGSEIRDEDFSGHPGMTILASAGGWSAVGFSPIESLRLGVSVLVASLTTVLAYVANRLRPNLPWWWAGVGMIAFNSLWVSASPTNAVYAVLLPAILVWAWMLYEQRDSLSQWDVIGFGVLLGVAAATRFAVTALVGGLLWLWLLSPLGWRRWLTVGLMGFGVMYLIDILWWQQPVVHLMHMLGRVPVHALQVQVGKLALVDYLLFAPLAMVSFGLALSLLIGRRKLRTESLTTLPPHIFLWVVILISVLLALILSMAATQSIRYYFPLIYWWEFLLPLFALVLVQMATARAQIHKLILALLVLAQAWLLAQVLVL